MMASNKCVWPPNVYTGHPIFPASEFITLPVDLAFQVPEIHLPVIVGCAKAPLVWAVVKTAMHGRFYGRALSDSSSNDRCSWSMVTTASRSEYRL